MILEQQTAADSVAHSYTNFMKLFQRPFNFKTSQQFNRKPQKIARSVTLPLNETNPHVVFSFSVPQQGFLLYATADWGGLSNRSSRCPHSPAHVDHTSPTTSGNTAVSHSAWSWRSSREIFKTFLSSSLIEQAGAQPPLCSSPLHQTVNQSIPVMCSLCLSVFLSLYQSSLKSNKKKKRTSFKRKSSKKGAEVSVVK